MIRVERLTKWYGPVLALDRIDLNVERGRIVGFLGPNGAGKTTAIRILTGFLPAGSGRASINGHDVFSDSMAVRSSIGYLPESTPLYPEMRVDEQLHYFGKLHGLSRTQRRKRITELNDACGLTNIIRRPIGQLSKGNRQRVGLAQALVHDPPVLILDEPTVGMDPAQIASVRQFISDLGQKKTVLLSTHILPEAERTCNQVVIITGGKIVADGTPEQLKASVRSRARVRVEVKANPLAVKQALEPVEGVAGVTTTADHGWCTALIDMTQKNDENDALRERLAKTVTEHGWPLRSLGFEGGSLEEFFIEITSRQASAVA